MAIDPADRYATVLDLTADVERWLADEPVSAWSEPLMERYARICRHQPVESLALTSGVAFFPMVIYYQLIALIADSRELSAAIHVVAFSAPLLYLLLAANVGFSIAILATFSRWFSLLGPFSIFFSSHARQRFRQWYVPSFWIGFRASLYGVPILAAYFVLQHYSVHPVVTLRSLFLLCAVAIGGGLVGANEPGADFSRKVV
jgi:hypothetical protein